MVSFMCKWYFCINCYDCNFGKDLHVKLEKLKRGRSPSSHLVKEGDFVWNTLGHLLVPYGLAGGTLSLLAVRPSVCLSVSQSVTIQFSRLFSAVFWDIDFKFGIWICHNIIQIKFDLSHAWLTFTWVIDFFCSLLRYWLEIWCVNWFWLHTDQVRVSSRLTYFYRSYCPLLKFSIPDFPLQPFEILTWHLVYEWVLN